MGIPRIVDRERYAPGMTRQLEALRAAIAAGAPRRGWKVGINAPEVLQSLGLRHSGVGWIDGRRVIQSGAEFRPEVGSRIHVEPELCIHLEGPVAASTDASDAIRRVAGVSPALEIVDYAKTSDGFDSVVAHAMFHAAVVLAARVPWEAPPGIGSTLPILRVNGERGTAPRQGLVPSNLGELLRFVAAFLEAFGESLEAGDVVLTGSYTERAAPLTGGDLAEADFGSLGSVHVRIGEVLGVDPGAREHVGSQA